MTNKPKKEEPEGDPERGDTILKRMLKTPPKQHKDMKKGKAKKAASHPMPNAGSDRDE
jgi:hypothetical protein